MSIPLKPLGKVRDIVQSTGLDISYAYDDLVFSDHSMFILQFDEVKDDTLHLFFNTDCNPAEAQLMEKRLVTAGQIGDFTIKYAGFFKLSQIDGKEELKLEFLS